MVPLAAVMLKLQGKFGYARSGRAVGYSNRTQPSAPNRGLCSCPVSSNGAQVCSAESLSHKGFDHPNCHPSLADSYAISEQKNKGESGGAHDDTEVGASCRRRESGVAGVEASLEIVDAVGAVADAKLAELPCGVHQCCNPRHPSVVSCSAETLQDQLEIATAFFNTCFLDTETAHGMCRTSTSIAAAKEEKIDQNFRPQVLGWVDLCSGIGNRS